MGTGGGIYHFRDLIKSNVSDKDAFFVINGDICADLPLVEMLQFHRDNVGEKGFTILGTEVSSSKSRVQFYMIKDIAGYRKTIDKLWLYGMG